MIYRVRHKTAYAYGDTVLLSHHMLHLTPRSTDRQKRLETRLIIEPEPAGPVGRRRDYYGNDVAIFELTAAHRRFAVESSSLVAVEAPTLPAPEATEDWRNIAADIANNNDTRTYELIDFAGRNEHSQVVEALRDYVRPSFPEGRPILEAAHDLTCRIHEDFDYVPGSTDVTTSVASVMKERRGVCQDFAHFMIAGLRALGLPARYVSGYIRTVPPEGKERLVGADQSHAWVGVYMRDAGWIDLDPTNACFAGEDHITLAWGRTYADVSPVKGVLTGGGEHQLKVEVDVIPAETDPARDATLVA